MSTNIDINKRKKKQESRQHDPTEPETGLAQHGKREPRTEDRRHKTEAKITAGRKDFLFDVAII